MQTLQSLRSCRGRHLILGTRPGPAPEPSFALAGILAEHEAAGEPIVSVSLRLARRADANWAEPALRWLYAHGRRVILRTCAVMPRSLVMAARDCGAVVQLELAHHRSAFQRALVGPEADAAAALLLQAQHLLQISIGVVAHLGPIFPVIHEHGDPLTPLLHHIAAAAVGDVHITPGLLTSARLEALAQLVDPSTVHALRRAYGLGRAVDHHHRYQGGRSSGRGPWRLRPFTQRALVDHVASLVREHDLELDRCGCSLACHLDRRRPERPAYVSFEPRKLFQEPA